MSIGVPNINFQAASLRHGYGDECMLLLEGLLKHALAAKGFEFKKPSYPAVDDLEDVEGTSRAGTAMSQTSDSMVDEVEKKKTNKRIPFVMPDELAK